MNPLGFISKGLLEESYAQAGSQASVHVCALVRTGVRTCMGAFASADTIADSRVVAVPADILIVHVASPTFPCIRSISVMVLTPRKVAPVGAFSLLVSRDSLLYSLVLGRRSDRRTIQECQDASSGTDCGYVMQVVHRHKIGGGPVAGSPHPLRVFGFLWGGPTVYCVRVATPRYQDIT